MTQYVINIGTIPNDGTGDPLRTAFNETNLNFDQIFAAGPVLSNIQIANNTILTTNTNGNLVLAPNGIGVVQANVNLVPNTSNVRNLGSADRRWSTLYVQYANVTGSITVADFTATGNVTVGGNLSVTGNIINVANIITDAKIIQLANTAGTANAADGSGITVGANDAIATMLFNSSINAWTTNIGISATGNIYGNFVAPGANGQVLYNRSGVIGTSPFDFNFNEATQTLFVTVGSFSGLANGTNALFVGAPGFTELGSNIMAQFTGNVASYSQINLQNTSNASAASGDYIITADNGDDTTYYLDIGLGSSTHADPDFFGDTGSANDGYLYVTANDQAGPGNSNVGNLILGSTNGVVKLFVGNTAQANVVQTISTDGITVVGNITGNYFIGNGSQLTGMYANANAVAYGAAGWAGNIVPASNVTYSLGNSTNWWSNVWVAGNTIYIGGVPLGMSAGNVLTVDGNAVLQNDSNTSITTTGDITAGNIITNGIRSEDSTEVTIQDGLNVTGDIVTTTVSAIGNITADYFFGNGSQLTGKVANAVYADSAGTAVTVPAGNVTGLSLVATSGNYSDLSGTPTNVSAFTNDAGYITAATANVISVNGQTGIVTLTIPTATSNLINDSGFITSANIPTNVSAFINDAGYITANVTGTISATGNITGNYFIGNGSQLTGLPASYTDANVTTLLSNLGSNVISGTGNITTTANISGQYIIGNGSQLTGLPAGYANSDVANFLAAYGSNTISTTGNITAGNLIGNISITGNVTGTSANVTLVAGSYSWTFDNTGQATFPETVITTPVPLANLTAVNGGRAFVNDANLTASGNFGAQVGSGGANTVPVWSDGSNWYIG